MILKREERPTNVPASYLVPIRDGQVLMLQRKNTGYMDGYYSFIAGHVEQGESFTGGVIREAREEAGLTLDERDLQVSHVMHRKSDDSVRVDVFFTAARWEGSPENREPHKCSDLSWFPLENLPERTIPYIRKALDCISRKRTYSEYGW